MILLLLAALAVPVSTGYVTDLAGMLNGADRAALEQQLRDYQTKTTNEVAVLIVPSLDGEDIEGYTNRVFHAWGVGQHEKNNGVLFVWATKERKVRIEVGYGLEPVLPDGRAGQIIRENITPAFREQRWRDGVMGGVSAILTQLEAKADPVVVAPSTPHKVWLIVLLLVVVGGGLFIIGLLVYLSDRLREREEQARLVRQFRNSFDNPYPTPPSHYPVYLPQAPRAAVLPAPSYRKKADEEEESRRRRRSSSDDSSPSYSSSSSSSSDSGSWGGFGGGDSGGGGASGSY